MLLRIFQEQVKLQCQAVAVATIDLNRAMTTTDNTGLWIAIQNLLGAAANISKALWGSGGMATEDREPLRTSLEVDDSSPLRNVAMRNHFEHFDERLERWWKTSEAHNHLDLSVMPPGAVEGLADLDMFRVFDPTSSELVFWGQRFNLQEIAAEATRLLPIAARESNKPHWDTSPPSSGGSGQ